MNNIFSYLTWRGDLKLTQSPFNEVDNLVLSTLSYLDFSGIVPKNGKQDITIQRAAAEYFSLHGIPQRPDPEKASSLELREWMLYLMADTRRFRNMRLSCLVQILDTEQVKQFSAMTILVSRKQIYLSFRGTSDDLTGWKEDFLMACMPEVPSQEEAVLYTERVAAQYPDHRLLLGGHSKGGNLAVYAAVQASPEIQRRIDSVWSNDGPGFQEAFLSSEAYQAVSHKIRSIVPKSSVVGMLLAHPENYQIVDSSQIGLLQHDGLSWQIMGDHFVTLPELTRESIRTDQRIRKWMKKIPQEERKEFVDALFDVLNASGAHTLSEVRKDRVKTITSSFSSMKELPKETRDRILEFIMLLNLISRRLNDENRINQTEKILEKVPSLSRRARHEKQASTNSERMNPHEIQPSSAQE